MKYVQNNFEIESIIDSDGHLNIYIETIDKSDIIEIDTGQGDGINGEQLALRFTTIKIEKNYQNEGK